MSRFEQRKDLGPRERLAAKKIDVPKGNALVHLENTGDPATLLRQQNLYWREGYDTLHTDDSGVYMHLPREEVEKNEARYRRDAENRLLRPAPVGLDREFKEEGNTAGLSKATTPQEFLEEDQD